MGDTTKIRTGGPKPIGGYAFRAPLGTTAPTVAKTALNAAYKDLGFVEEDGVNLNPQTTIEKKKDWNLDTIATVVTDKSCVVEVTFAECGPETLKAIYGANNVTYDQVTEALHLSWDGEPLPHEMFDFELLGATGKPGRLVINDGQITTPGGGEKTYKKAEIRTHKVTIECFKDASGKYYHEYEDKAV